MRQQWWLDVYLEVIQSTAYEHDVLLVDATIA